MPSRIDSNPLNRSRLRAAVCRVAIAHSGPVAPVAVAVRMELGACDPVPAPNAPAIPYQLQQGFWGGAQAGVASRGALDHYRQV
jgi:hypothetical protein